jgi:hypothetical protein
VTKYLFRIDSSKDNDKFFGGAKDQGIDHVYAGTLITLGVGWVPDFLMVTGDGVDGYWTLTLIELEAKRADALISSRKYLPESSAKILDAFHEYLARVIDQCRSTADPRVSVFEGLQAVLQNAMNIRVETACALRSELNHLERLPLMDQSQTEALPYSHSFKPDSPQVSRTTLMTFEGRITLSRDQTIGLNRAVLILDAIVRQQDHSDAILKAWVSPKRNPLRKAIHEERKDLPEISRFLATDKNSGAKISCEALFGELSDFWSETASKRLESHVVRDMVSAYYPSACALKMGDRMRDVFEGARKVVETWAPDSEE